MGSPQRISHVPQGTDAHTGAGDIPQPGSGFEPGCRVSALAAVPSKLMILVEEQTRIETQASSRSTRPAERTQPEEGLSDDEHGHDRGLERRERVTKERNSI